jgi:hypothetical protein
MCLLIVDVSRSAGARQSPVPPTDCITSNETVSVTITWCSGYNRGLKV